MAIDRGCKMIQKILRLLSLLSLLGLIGCDPVEGDLVVKESLQIKKVVEPCNDYSANCFNQEERQTIEPGGYDMKMDVESKKVLSLAISKKWALYKLELKIPDSKYIPSTGELSLSSNESGQPFDFKMKSQTDVSETAIQQGSESCTESIQTEVCYVVPGTPPRQKCELKWVTAKGMQYVEFYYRTTQQRVSAVFSKISSDQVLASYDGSRSDSQKIYTRKDRCELFRPYIYN